MNHAMAQNTYFHSEQCIGVTMPLIERKTTQGDMYSLAVGTCCLQAFNAGLACIIKHLNK